MTEVRSAVAAIEAGIQPAAARLESLLDLYWDWAMTEYPESATVVGYPGQDDRWTDVSRDAIERRKGDITAFVEAAGRIAPSELDDAAALNHALFARDVALTQEGDRFPEELIALGPMSGPQSTIPRILTLVPAASTRACEDLLARLRAVPGVVGQVRALLAEGIARGVTPPRVVLAGVPAQVEALCAEDPEESPLLAAFRTIGPDVGDPDGIRARAADALASAAVPAFRALHEYITDTYIPACRESIALTELPDGADWYAHRIRRFTSTSMTAQEIHSVGLDEVARIRAAMDEVIARADFEGSFDAWVKHLHTDDRYFFDEASALLVAYRDICKRIDPTLVRLFRRQPRLPYGVEPVPDYQAERSPTAYYMPCSAEAGRAGTFYANTFDLRSRPAWEMEALTLHEAVPGHHFQIAIAQELESLPEFRRHGHETAYIEGWGLYAEHLGEELGFYTEPASKFGQLAYEMWRAGRLVVDTGMHALGWDRQRAIEFLLENTGKARHDIEVEIDRYISWPGQALAYKLGELTFKRLRARAKEALGERFDVRAFHDALLADGALPLEVLEQRIDAWISAQ